MSFIQTKRGGKSDHNQQSIDDEDKTSSRQRKGAPESPVNNTELQEPGTNEDDSEEICNQRNRKAIQKEANTMCA